MILVISSLAAFLGINAIFIIVVFKRFFYALPILIDLAVLNFYPTAARGNVKL